MLNKIRLYSNTLRYLRWRQIFSRVVRRFDLFRCDLDYVELSHSSASGIQYCFRKPNMNAPYEFCFLSVEGDTRIVGWDGPEREKLWRYNQHYFDDLNAAGWQDRGDWHVALLNDWLQHNPPFKGTGWEPAPTSLRIVNWVKWVLAGNQLPEGGINSLALQARWLRGRLETHILGNHYFTNAKALVFAGLLFEGAEAEEWLKKGMSILREEVPEQILSDGAHFELSTMYHALATEDMLDLVNAFEAVGGERIREHSEQIQSWKKIIPGMLAWMNSMCHPDGQIAFFNDAAFDIAPLPQDLLDYARRLGFAPSKTMLDLAESGYARLENSAAVVIADLAAIGPDYIPGHAHADTLSFELSLFGRRVFVNSGASCYGTSDERLRQRGTAAHNTVVVDGANSSEVWSGFRVARRARVIARELKQTDAGGFARGIHDGYKRFRRGQHHERTWSLEEGLLEIRDTLTNQSGPASAHFHLHPSLNLELEGEHAGRILDEDGQVLIRIEALQGRASILDSSWHPRFGEVLKSKCLCIDIEGAKSAVRFSWQHIGLID